MEIASGKKQRFIAELIDLEPTVCGRITRFTFFDLSITDNVGAQSIPGRRAMVRDDRVLDEFECREYSPKGIFLGVG